MTDQNLSYSSAGVDIAEAERALRSVTDAIKATHSPRVIAGVGAFGAVFDATPAEGERNLLVSSIDGVGTKTKVAAMMNDWSGIGADIVNHCVNDILCQGAKPLFFLDYFGCARLSTPIFNQVVTSAATACGAVGCALIGGETAEMPGVYHDDEVDIVGCIVGQVSPDKQLPKPSLQPGDVIIGLLSDGLHTNGFSLARKALEVGGVGMRDEFGDDTVGSALLKPHRCYFKSVFPLVQEGVLRAIAHITGGGIGGNLNRVLPSTANAVIHRDRWEVPELFSLLQKVGQIGDAEMFEAFNMGIGMTLVVPHDSATTVIRRLSEMGDTGFVIGEIVNGSGTVQIV